MSKPRSKRRLNTPQEDDSDDEPGPSQARGASQSQGRGGVMEWDPEECNRRVNDLVQYLLVMDQRKLPIKKLDIKKHVLKDLSKRFEPIMDSAREKLLKVFGIEVIETDMKQKSYILINNHYSDAEAPHLSWSPEDNAKTGLLMIILGLIFMNGNVVQDTLMWHILAKMGLEVDHHHEVFGDIKKLVTQEFVRQGYLEYIRQPQSDPPAYDFKWGFRAMCETSKKKVLEFVCQIYGDEVNPEQWTSQWQEVEREGALANGAED